jgi:uncharacterized protein with HEPN domain
MDDRIKKWVYDIKLSIDEINSFFIKPHEFESYSSNIMLKRAVERNLGIIGEAINKIKKANPVYLDRITEAGSIIALRNHVIHAYDSISDENIYSILINHLPTLQKEIEEIIETSSD